MYNVASFLLTPFHNMSIDIPLIACAITLFSSIIMLRILQKHRIVIIFKACILVSIICMCSSITIISTAKDHGCDNVFAYTIKSLTQHISTSPKESHVPDDLTGAVIIYYRFGCNDCESIYHDLQQYTHNWPNTYWVATRSTQGQALRKKYPVSDVPAGVYVTHSGKSVIQPLITQNGLLNTNALTNIKTLLSYETKN